MDYFDFNLIANIFWAEKDFNKKTQNFKNKLFATHLSQMT